MSKGADMSNATTLEILHRDDLPLGGFAGLREHRLVQDRRAWGDHRDPQAWDGIGNFVYLADARFIPKGDTGMHPHHEVDVISVMVDGRIAHGGSLEDGQSLVAGDVQVQRAGGEGFQHNEVNPDETENRMIQLWVLPDEKGQPAGYRVYKPRAGAVTRIYGGNGDQNETFASRTTLDVAMLGAGQEIQFDGLFLAYLTKGRGLANGNEVADGDLLRGEGLSFEALEDVQLTVVQRAD
jgi:redox-sensitive bicupin YhaK (pirin superfamily)